MRLYQDNIEKKNTRIPGVFIATNLDNVERMHNSVELNCTRGWSAFPVCVRREFY